jgi:hypothetical protein
MIDTKVIVKLAGKRVSSIIMGSYFFDAFIIEQLTRRLSSTPYGQLLCYILFVPTESGEASRPRHQRRMCVL